MSVQGALTEVIAVAAQHGAITFETHEPTLEEIFLRFYEAESSPALLAR
jgi:hypothetical protein